MADPRFNRRQTLRLFAAGFAGAAGITGMGLGATNSQAAIRHWRGPVLGGNARISLAGFDAKRAHEIVTTSLAEVERLEKCFSLFRPNSEISQLNATGILERPTQDFRLLLARACNHWQHSYGAFNPAVQPIWRYLQSHFTTTPDQEPDAAKLAALAKQCNPALITATAERITMPPHMALTFNGIAQGYITDRVSMILTAEGLHDILVELGEIRSLPGREWRIGFNNDERPIILRHRALATSAGHGMRFSRDGRWTHLLDPRGQVVNNQIASVSVEADNACDADAVATALAVAPSNRHDDILQNNREVRATIHYNKKAML